MGPTVPVGLAAASQSSTAATTTAHFDGLSEGTAAYVMAGKRRVPQRLPGRAIARDPKPVTEATIALPREGSPEPTPEPQPEPQPQPKPDKDAGQDDWIHRIRPDRHAA